MRRAVLLAVVLATVACKNPFGYEPPDPTPTDPPDPPVLIEPPDGKLIKNYAYPQDVRFEWQPVQGAAYYQFEVFRSTNPAPESLCGSAGEITGVEITATFRTHGFYCWRVRAGSPYWTWYTEWSEVSRFSLPNPTR